MATAVIIIAAGLFAAGVLGGIIAVVSIGILREERRFARTYQIGLGKPAPDRTTAGARSISGLYVHRDDAVPAPRSHEDTLV